MDKISINEHLLSSKLNFQSKIIKFSVFSLLLINFFLLGIDGLNNASDPEAWDTTAYLGEANFIKAHGGISNFINLCITGEWKQDNQHPLYILFITPFASTEISFFVISKIINFSIAIILFFILYVLVSRKYGDVVAAFSVLGLMFSNIFLEWTTLVACESSIMLFGFLSIVFIYKGFEKNKFWALAGVFAGLAYLSKAIGIALIPGFIISSIAVYKFKVVKNKYFWSFILLFSITASPLLIRNTLFYDNPFFNYNVYIVKYGIQKFEKIQYVIFNMTEGSSIWKFDDIDNGNDSIDYSNINKSSLTSIDRIINVTKAFINSFNILQKYFGDNYFWITGSILIIFLLFGIIRLDIKGAKYFIISSIILFLLLLSFNPYSRYFLVLTPAIWVCIALGVTSFLEFLKSRIKSENKAQIFNKSFQYLFVLCLILFLVYNSMKLNITNPFNSVEYSSSRQEILNWLRANLNDSDKYTLGPNFYWQINKGTWILPPNPAKYKDFSKLESFVKRHDVRYIIIDSQIILKYKSDELLKDKFKFDSIDGITQVQPIKDWQLIYKDNKRPVDFLIFSSTGKKIDESNIGL